MSIQDVITGLQNDTTQVQAANAQSNKGTSNVSDNSFLQLLMQELQTQDPLSPMDNTEFISQQAQFTQIEQLQQLNSNVTSSTDIMQASSLIGHQVTLTDTNNNVVSGTVTQAQISSSGAGIMINNTSYPLSSITSVQ